MLKGEESEVHLAMLHFQTENETIQQPYKYLGRYGRHWAKWV
jgi:hypothetical protein